MCLGCFLALVDLAHPADRQGIGESDRSSQVETGMEATVCIEQTLPNGDKIGIVESKLCLGRSVNQLSWCKFMKQC